MAEVGAWGGLGGVNGLLHHPLHGWGPPAEGEAVGSPGQP